MKKFLSILLCLSMLVSVFCVSASAKSPVNIFNITVEVPQAGNKPDYNASVPKTASTKVVDVEWKGNFDENGCFTGPFRPYRIGVRRMDSWEMRQAENALAENRMEDAKRWYPEAARQGIVEAQYQAGLLLRQEPEEAFAWMQKAADSRMPEAMEMLGRYYAEGFGCTPNAANAAYWADAAKKYR